MWNRAKYVCPVCLGDLQSATLKPSHCRLRRLAQSLSWRNHFAKADHHELNIDALGNNAAEVFFDNVNSRRAIAVEGDGAVPSRIDADRNLDSPSFCA